MPTIGVLFDIDELGGGYYGPKAYRTFFAALDTRLLWGCRLADGDTNKTLVGRAREYCIAVESYDPSQATRIVGSLRASTINGLRPVAERFLYEERLAHEPLVPAARIDHHGIITTESGWLREAWNEAQIKGRRKSILSESLEISDDAPTLVPTVSGGARYVPPATLEPSEKALKPREYNVGELIGNHYRILDIRRGAMGLVYIVDDVQRLKEGISLRLALKTFQHKYLWETQAIRRFEREAIQWVELGYHINIVYALVVLEVEAFPYLWLEYVDGDSLAERLNQGMPALSEGVDLSLQFVRGMRYAHETCGLVHRDIKPANILLTKDDILKIADFGLSKLRADLMRSTAPTEGVALPQESALSDQYRTTPGAWVGTPAYMSPEAITDPDNVDTRSDIYSFGIVMFELFTGSRPFRGRAVFRSQIHQSPTRPSSLNPAVPVELDTVILKCLEKDRESRFASFAQLESALFEIQRAVGVELRPWRAVPVVSQKDHNFNKAFTLMTFERYEEALDWFKRALEFDPQDAEIQNNIAVCLGELGCQEDALRYAEASVSTRPTYAVAWSNLGGICCALARYEKGIEACRRALELEPNWAEAHANMGVNLVGLRRLKEAEEYFKAAVLADPKYWKAYSMAAEVSTRQDAPPEEILPLLEKAHAIRPRDARVLAFMAACLDDLGKREEAQHYLSLAFEIDPRDPLALKVQKVLQQRGYHKE